MWPERVESRLVSIGFAALVALVQMFECCMFLSLYGLRHISSQLKSYREAGFSC